MLSEADFFNFLELPRELQVVILAQLALRDTSAITEVSRALHNLVRNTPTLQYPIELLACGMRDNLFSPTAITERLGRLRQHDHAWRTLSWSSSTSFTVPPEGGVRSKQGLIVIAKEQSHPELGLDVHQLIAQTRSIPGRVWTIEPRRNELPRVHGLVYETDSSQDLLIIRHGTAREDTFFDVYSLSDGLPHPKATLPKFRISNTDVGDGLQGSTAGAFIRRDYIYLFDHRFEIYNWKLGERAMDLSRFSMLDQCAFVSDRYLATLCVSLGPSPAGLLVFELPQSEADEPRRYPVNIPVLAFLLPEIETHQDTETRWELIGGAAQSSADTGMAEGGDFATNRDETLFMILFRVEQQWYELVVPTQRLLAFLPNPDRLSMNASMLAIREVLWSEWGPQHTRVRRIGPRLDRQERSKLHASLFGMRRVFHHPVHTSTGELAARVEDYQLSRVRRAEAREDSSHLVRHGDTAEGSWAEGNELHTMLPFLVVDTILPSRWQGRTLAEVDISINEDGIVIAERETGGHEQDEALTL